jgi:hypothetical protein
VLIRRARAVSGDSPERAAARLLIPLSGARWRQIEAGYVLRRGAWIKTGWVDDVTVAHMAWSVGVDPDQLAASRPEAAEIVREITRQHPPTSSELADDIDAALARLEAKLERMKRDPRKIRKLEAMIDLIDGEAS